MADNSMVRQGVYEKVDPLPPKREYVRPKRRLGPDSPATPVVRDVESVASCSYVYVKVTCGRTFSWLSRRCGREARVCQVGCEV